MPFPAAAMIKDFLPAGRPGYFLLARPDYFCFFSMRPGKWVRLHAERDVNGDIHASLNKFIGKLKTDGVYFGQEITILIAEPAAYTFIRSQEDRDLEALREECRTLIPVDIPQEFRSIMLFGKPHLVVFGIDRDFATRVYSALDSYGVPVSQIMPFSGLVLNNLIQASADWVESGIYKISIGDFQSLLITNNNGPAYLEFRGNDIAIEDILKIDQAIGLEKLSARSLPPEKKNMFALKGVLPPISRHILTAAGSARLMISAVSILLVLFAATGLVFSLLRSGSQDLYDRYQDNLAEMVTLENGLARLDRELRAIGPEYLTMPELSARLSAFCQRIPGNIYLTELRIERDDTGSIRVTARGAAKNETSVFRYRDFINDAYGADEVGINSIAKASQYRSLSDSALYRFTLVNN